MNGTARKSSGVCCVCGRVCKLLFKNGTVHKHGFGANNQACTGSYRPPCANSIPGNATFSTTFTTQSASFSTQSTQFAHTAVNSQSNADLDISLTGDRPFVHPELSKPLIKIIPKNSRVSCGQILNKILDGIVEDSSRVHRWNDLLHFGSELLSKPARGGKQHNLGNLINKRTAAYTDHGPTLCTGPSVTTYKSSKPDKKYTDSILAAAVTSKLEDGNLRAAIRLICSEDAVATHNDETLAGLAEKHPKAPVDRETVPRPIESDCLQVSCQDVREAMKSFPAGSSGGPDGITPRHLQDLISGQHVADGILQSLTAFVNLMLRAEIPEVMKEIIFGGRLIALQKKSGGIRPIAIGYTWRRLVAKCACKYATKKLAPLLSPLQLGVGVPNGCEAAVHAARRFIEDLRGDRAFVKLDFTNAFNSLRRDRMLTAVSTELPELYDFCQASYGKSSILKFGTYDVFSEEGVQQGDPLGPLLFCITLHELLEGLQSDLRIGYLDDISIGGDGVDLAHDLNKIIAGGEEIGLQLNVSKCEIIKSPDFIDRVEFQNFTHIDKINACLLGAPLSTGPAMNTCLSIRCDDLTRAIERLDLLPSHDALTILKSALSTPKLMYTLRSSPCTNHTELERSDSTLRSGLSRILNVSITDIGWIQASLPVCEGGLGIRSAAHLAPSAFLASAASTQDLQSQILRGCEIGVDLSIDMTKSLWQSRYEAIEPHPEIAHRQRAWDQAAIDNAVGMLFQNCRDERDRARLLAVSSPHAGDWLHALPISACGLRLDNETIRIAVGLRLGADICEPHTCPCGSDVDFRGTHGLSCRSSAGRLSRHAQINDLVWRSLSRANIPSVKEPRGLSKTDERRPDGRTLIPWKKGKCLAWDSTVADTYAPTYLNTTSVKAGSAAECLARLKSDKYRDLTQRYIFCPVAVETMGSIGEEGIELLSAIGRQASDISGEPREGHFIFQRLSIL